MTSDPDGLGLMLIFGLLGLALLALAACASACVHWYLARHRRRLREFVRGWDSRQDFVHRVAARGRCERAGLR